MSLARPLHIGFVAHNFIRGHGQGRINYEIARHALRTGHRLTLLAENVAPDLQDAGATVHSTRPLLAKPNLAYVYGSSTRADRLLDRLGRQFDVVVGTGFSLRRPHDVNLCQFVHGAWLRSPVHIAKLRPGPYGFYQRWFSAANARWERQTYAQSRVVIAPSRRIRDELVGIGVPPTRIEVIYNGVDLDEFRPPTDAVEKHALRKTLGLPIDRPLALFVGDLRTPRKNLDSVLRALDHVPEAILVVIGRLAGSPFPALARTLGVEGRTRFLGFRDDVASFMRACDLFVFPSRYEAGTLVLMEAAASGLPIVTARTASGAELFEHDAAVIVEDPDDVAAIAAGIVRFFADPTARAEVGARARQIVAQHDWSRMADAYLDVVARFACRERVAAAAPTVLPTLRLTGVEQ